MLLYGLAYNPYINLYIISQSDNSHFLYHHHPSVFFLCLSVTDDDDIVDFPISAYITLPIPYLYPGCGHHWNNKIFSFSFGYIFCGYFGKMKLNFFTENAYPLGSRNDIRLP